MAAQVGNYSFNSFFIVKPSTMVCAPTVNYCYMYGINDITWLECGV